jgi:hypothetical protein
MPDSDGTVEQSMEETLKTLERQLTEENETEDQPSPSAEILKLPEAATDSRKGRAQNRVKGPSGAPQSPTAAEGLEHVPSETSALEPAASESLAGLQRMVPNLFGPSDAALSATLEDIVRELVKPMLRSHLDAKLGEIINRLVQAELTKAVDEVGAS